MRWRVKKGGKECSRGKVKVVGSVGLVCLGGRVVEVGAREGVRAVDEGLEKDGG